MALPLLYSYRRCPYAMRARMALIAAGIPWRHCEISLRDKPAAMIAASPKGTVPVLVLATGEVIDQSLAIMLWALGQNDGQNWLVDMNDSLALISVCDETFKPALDRYKYFTRHPEKTQSQYRAEGEIFLALLEGLLQKHPYLAGDDLRLGDIAIFPFVRQFSKVDIAWFRDCPYPRLREWLAELEESDLFRMAMRKFENLDEEHISSH